MTKKNIDKQETSSRNGLRKEEKCCGNCCWFKQEDLSEWGDCYKKKIPDQMVYCENNACKNYISEQQAERYLHVLTEHNKWRRGDNSLRMQDPKELGKAIDFAVDYIKTFIKL